MATLTDSEYEILPFFELTPDLVCIADRNGFFKNVNRAVVDKLGYTKEELLTNPIFSYIHPEDRELTIRERTKLIEGTPLINFQNRYITKSGTIIWLDWTSIYFPDKGIVFAIAKDVSKRKVLENEIEEKYAKFKSLATHFKAIIEKDRKYLAAELHEELAQLAFVVKMDIAWLKSNITDLPEATKNKIEHGLAVSELLIKAIRRISFSVSPTMLDDFGLEETMLWLCNEFSVMNGIPCEFQGKFDDALLTQEMKFDFFRICQEALSNILYHAEANSVKICVEDFGDKISLTIIDDGKGFIVEEQKQTSGLTSMRERAASINGLLTVKSKPGKGTEISVCVAHQKE